MQRLGFIGKLRKIPNKTKWTTSGIQLEVVLSLQCVNCSKEIEVTWSDYTIQICVHCKVESVFYHFDEKKALQIIPAFAPDVIETFIKWAEKGKLDELEFFELIMYFEEIAKSIGKL